MIALEIFIDISSSCHYAILFPPTLYRDISTILISFILEYQSHVAGTISHITIKNDMLSGSIYEAAAASFIYLI